MASGPKPSGENWSRAAKSYTNLIDTSDSLNPAGAACRQILDVVDTSLPFDQASYIIDMGTGPGPVISSVLDSPQHTSQIPAYAKIIAADVAQGLLDILAQHKAEREETEPAWKRLEIKQWDGRNLQAEIQDGEVSHLLSSYAYFAMTNEKDALLEAYRVLKPGGIFVETSMGDTEWGRLPQFFKTVRPEMTVPGPGAHWQSVDGVKATLEAAGFKDVKAREFQIGIPCQTHKAAVELVFQVFPFVAGLIADMSEVEVAKAKDAMMGFVKERHPEAPLRLMGTGLIGWATK